MPQTVFLFSHLPLEAKGADEKEDYALRGVAATEIVNCVGWHF